LKSSFAEDASLCICTSAFEQAAEHENAPAILTDGGGWCTSIVQLLVSIEKEQFVSFVVV